MDKILAELDKIPSVTRFLTGSHIGITGAVLMNSLSPYRVLYVAKAVFRELRFGDCILVSFWACVYSVAKTSMSDIDGLLSGGGINFIFEIEMLYRTIDGLETGPYARKSGDLAWQLLVACAAIVATSYPVKSFLFFRPLLLCVTYVSSYLAPPGSQTSLFGLITFPVKYMPYMMLGFDLLMGGPQAAAQSLPGALVGHLWWWGVWGDQAGRPGPYAHYGRAPRWLAQRLGDTSGPGGQANAGNAGGGVHVVPPRTRINTNAPAGGSGSGSSGSSTGHSWGSGQRLGNS